MWHLILLLIGFVFCSENGTDAKTHVVLVGEDVSLQCPGISKNDPILGINWKHSDGTPYFYCDQDTITCDENTTEHSLEREGDTYISILTIRNASLIHEDEYSFTMFTSTYKKHCQISLKINVPPMGLILVDKRHGQDDEVLQYNGTLKADEGENKTIVCKTNTSIKPVANLEWVIPEELNVTSEYGEQIQDERDDRLFVSTRTLSFTPHYTFDDDISLVCKVASIESFEHIQTLIHIRNKGSEVLNATMTADVTFQTEERESQTSDLWIRTVPRTPTPQPPSNQEALQVQGNTGTSEDGNGQYFSNSNEALGDHPIQEGVSCRLSHFYMEMKPVNKVNNPSKSSSSLTANVNIGEPHTSYAPRTKIFETEEGSQKEQDYVNSKNPFHKIELVRSQSLDSVRTTYI